MNLKLKYLPPVRRRLLIIITILFSIGSLALFALYQEYGILTILIYSVIYAFVMIAVFLFLTKSYYILVNEEKNVIETHKPFRKHITHLNEITGLELIESKRSYTLSITSVEHTKHFTLTGSLSFEEPLFVPFIRKIEQLKPDVNFGEFARGILHGGSKFDPWSPKMYYAYYVYISLIIGFYLFSLVFVYLLR